MEKEATIVSSPRHGFIWFDGDISQETARMFGKHLQKVNQEPMPRTMPILIYIRGLGGRLCSAVAMIEAMNRSRRRIITVAHGCVASASWALVQGGRWRYALPNARLMFHSAAIEFKPGEQINRENFVELSSAVIEANGIELGLFLRRGHPATDIADLMESDAEIDARQAKRLHLLDGMFSRKVFLWHRRIVRELIR